MKKLTIMLMLLATTLTAWATENDGATVETAIVLNEGVNTIAEQKYEDPARWYKTTAKSMKRTKVTFTGYPVMTAYLGSDLTQSLGTDNPVDYINEGEDQEIYICLTSTNEQELTATVSYAAPVADLSQFGALGYSIEKNGDVTAGGSITVTFPERVGGADDEAVELSFWVFSVKGGNPDGAPINLGGVTSATGTLAAGVEVPAGDFDLTVGKKYRLTVQSLRCGNHYAPGYDENVITNDHVDFYCAEPTGIVKVYENEDVNEDENGKVVYNLAGQRQNGDAKGVVIINGKKIVK